MENKEDIITYVSVGSGVFFIVYYKLDTLLNERQHKAGSGGSRIYDGSITDYECSKNPLHDFRRCYN